MTRLITRYMAIASFASIMLVANTISFAEAQTTSIRYKGQSADASWYFEQDGIYTSVEVFVTESASRQQSDSYTESVAYIGISQSVIGEEICYEYEGELYCWNEYVPINEYFGYGTITSKDFLPEGRLDGATLSTTLAGYNILTESESTISIDIDWTGEGNFLQGKDRYHYRSGDYIFNGNYIALYRQASATGSISGDITMELGNSDLGSLYNAKSGSVDVVHP